jgi:hypothetical protein
MAAGPKGPFAASRRACVSKTEPAGLLRFSVLDWGTGWRFAMDGAPAGVAALMKDSPVRRH